MENHMESRVSDHYNADELADKIQDALVRAGKDIERLNLKDLAPIDHLHTGGLPSSLSTLETAGIEPGSKVLDAGCGIGGTSRLLAQKFKCVVSGIDLASQFIDAANFLTRCTGLEQKIIFHQGSILDMPFEDQSFDIIVCQHILMNIKDKDKAAREFGRVLKKGGRLILNEITKGEGNDMKYPVPWASSPDISFLVPWESMLTILESAGLSKVGISDKTAFATKWWEKVKKNAANNQGAPSPLNPKLIFGDNAKFFGPHMHHNFENNAICLIEAVVKKG